MGGLKIKIQQFIYCVILIFLSGCQNDDSAIDEHHAGHDHIATQKVNLQDFPEILEHVNQMTSKDRPLAVKPSSNPYSSASRNGELVLLNVDLENAIQSLDENEKSNFAIFASAETTSNPTEFRFTTYNLVVSEYGDEAYSFIVEYEYDKNWIASQPVGDFDYTTLTGAIRFYDVYGQFVQEHTYVNGQVVTFRGSDPCNDDQDPDPDPTGGDGPTVVITCGCDPSHNGGSSSPVCSCSLPDIITIYNFGPQGGDTSKDPLRSPDPCGPGNGGGTGGGDGDGGNTPLPDECFLPNGDPIDCENPNIPLTPQELQENYFSLLTALGDLVPDFWTDYIPEMLWLGDHKEIASDMLYYLWLENYSDGAVHFAMEALASLMDGGDVNFDDKIILKPSFENNTRLKAIYDTFSQGSNTISQYLQNFESDFSVAHLRFSADDHFQSNLPPEYWDAGAITLPPENYVIDIIFNTDISLPSSSHNFPNIILAVELFHEMIHAEMFRKMLSQWQNPNLNFEGLTQGEWTSFLIGLMNEFPGIWDYFLRYEYNTTNPTSSHHQLMAAHYIGTMTQALADFDNNQHAPSFYEALAWIGLQNTVAWDLLSQSERDNITAIIANAIQNEPYD